MKQAIGSQTDGYKVAFAQNFDSSSIRGYQVIISKDSRAWDSIKPTIADAFRRIGSFLALDDNTSFAETGHLLECNGNNYQYSIECLSAIGFSVEIKVIY